LTGAAPVGQSLVTMAVEKFPLSRHDGVLIRDMAEETLIYDLTVDKAFCLNRTSALVFHECDGLKSVADISQILTARLETPVSENVVWLAIRQLKSDNLLANGADLVTPLDGISRREAVRRLGIASAVVLPLVSAVVVPSALHAQSAQCAGFTIPALTCVPGNTTDLSDDGCLCTGNPECAGVCPVASPGVPRYCVGGNTGPFCAPGNTLDLSIDCCPCTSNLECIGVCPVNPLPGAPPGTRQCQGGTD
jgi:hypothetical protein